MYGVPTAESLAAFSREVDQAVAETVKNIAAKYGLGNQVIVLGVDGGNSQEAADALETLQQIRALVN